MEMTAIIGIGNTLMSDDGAGVRVLELLDDLPDHVRIVELATGGMNLLHHLEDYDSVVIVDAVDFGGGPGEIRVFGPDEVRTVKTVGYSLHDLDILKVLDLAARLGTLPSSVRIAAIQPVSLEMKEGLTPPVEAALPELARRISVEVAGQKNPGR
ncbi:MAG: hydrogenase maturation protease [Cyclonatronaceae bacterium]